MHRPPSVHRTPSPCIARHSQCIVRRSFAPSAAYLHRTPSPSIAHHSRDIARRPRASPPPRTSPTAPCIVRHSVHRLPPLCIARRPFASPAAPLHRPPLLASSRRPLMVRNAAQCNPHCAYVARPGPVRAALPPGALFPLRRRGLTRLEPIRRHALLCASVVAGATRHDRPRGCKTWRALHGSTQSPARWPAQHTFASPAPHPRRCRRLCARRAGQIT